MRKESKEDRRVLGEGAIVLYNTRVELDASVKVSELLQRVAELEKEAQALKEAISGA